MTLAHDRQPAEQAPGQRARLTGAGTEIIECVKAMGDTRNRNPEFEIVQVIRNDEVIGHRVAGCDGAEGVSGQFSHRRALVRDD